MYRLTCSFLGHKYFDNRCAICTKLDPEWYETPRPWRQVDLS